MAVIYFKLGNRERFPKLTSAILWRLGASAIEGVLAWARDERTGEYVRVYECAPEDGDWIQGEHHGHWSWGNAETVDDAKRIATRAYYKINSNKCR